MMKFYEIIKAFQLLTEQSMKLIETNLTLTLLKLIKRKANKSEIKKECLIGRNL